MRRSLGTAVPFGMIGVTCFGLLFTPAFYTFIRKLGRDVGLSHHLRWPVISPRAVRPAPLRAEIPRVYGERSASSGLWFPKISSDRVRAVRHNQRIIRCDVCDPGGAGSRASYSRRPRMHVNHEASFAAINHQQARLSPKRICTRSLRRKEFGEIPCRPNGFIRCSIGPTGNGTAGIIGKRSRPVARKKPPRRSVVSL
jgi:hypothetical protein